MLFEANSRERDSFRVSSCDICPVSYYDLVDVHIFWCLS